MHTIEKGKNDKFLDKTEKSQIVNKVDYYKIVKFVQTCSAVKS